ERAVRPQGDHHQHTGRPGHPRRQRGGQPERLLIRHPARRMIGRTPSPPRHRKGPAVMSRHAPSRRELFAAAAALGLGTAPFHRALAAQAAADPPGPVTPAMVKDAEWVAGIKLTDAERKSVAAGMTQALRDYAALYK